MPNPASALGEAIGKSFEAEIQKLEETIISAIKMETQSPKNVDQIELLIKTTHKEYFVKKFLRATDAAKYLLSLTEDVADLKGKL